MKTIILFWVVSSTLAIPRHQGKEKHHEHHEHRTNTDSGDILGQNDLSLFRKENVNCHNRYRSKHHAPSVHQSHQLDKYAQKLAEELAARGMLEHSGGPHGENLFMSSGNVDGESACNAWYSEVKDYNFSRDNPQNFYKIGHFSQMVWKATRKIGVGRAETSDGKIIVVANYSPPGNFKDEYTANVSPK